MSELLFNGCFNLSSIEISPNSNLQTIEYGAFIETRINEIYFPTNLRELKKEWCLNANELTKIIVSPSNGQFVYKDDKYLLGKSNENNDDFDIIYFARRDIKKVFIPSNIKVISPNTFHNCEYLTKVKILPTINFLIFFNNIIRKKL